MSEDTRYHSKFSVPSIGAKNSTVLNGIEKILTEKGAENLWKETGQNVSGIKKLKSKIIMKYFPKIFEKKVMESTNREYKSTPKENNAW